MKAEGILNSNEFEKRVLKEIDKYVIQKIVGEHLFVKRSVHDLLWGYTDPLLSDIIKVQNDINYFLSKFHKKIHLLDSAVFGFGVSACPGTGCHDQGFFQGGGGGIRPPSALFGPPLE